jgi:hypothetical protein
MTANVVDKGNIAKIPLNCQNSPKSIRRPLADIRRCFCRSGAYELRALVKDAVKCSFDESMETPKIIRQHFVRDEVLTQ